MLRGGRVLDVLRGLGTTGGPPTSVHATGCARLVIEVS